MITLTNKIGASVTLSNIGAGIISVVVPDKNGNMDDVILGYKDRESYFGDGPCAGKIPGRFANRIKLGKFTLDGVDYQLDINNAGNCLHGGLHGFSDYEWDYTQDGNKVVFSMVSPDGDQHFPGEVKVKATYIWNDDCELSLKLEACTNKTTIINLTNHAYWNLSGENSGTILDQKLQIFAHKWLPTDKTQIPTGELASVKDTPMDFTELKTIGRDIKQEFEALKIGKGYDHCWVIDNWKPGQICKVAKLTDDKSGRVLDITSDQPGVQMYSGNWLAGSPISKSGRSYNDNEGVALECQGFPDAPNKSNFPSSVLKPNEEYVRNIIWKFSVEK